MSNDKSIPRVLTVLGARPQFVKAAALCHRLQLAQQESGPLIEHVIVHTGQHFDPEMSRTFFDELGIPAPDVNLGVHSGGHGEMTGRMLIALEAELLARRPDAVLVYGDTNSTLAGALAAAKLRIPVAHVEAGLRSFDDSMPEELNRVLCDRLSALLFAPTAAAVQNLEREGITRGVKLVGDVMYDAIRIFSERARQYGGLISELGLEPGGYVLATCHRAKNVDDPLRLGRIFQGLGSVAQRMPVLLPLHPRTRQRLDAPDAPDLRSMPGLRIVKPLGYLQTLALLGEAAALVTDSGGMQKEAYVLGVPCVTVRGNTEWVETVDDRANVLADDDPQLIADRVLDQSWFSRGDPQRHYGRGDASRLILEQLLERLG
ncbi:MAG: UDP-N-acetylglucosamine 2-epimerase (non-hydrolyzing) [Candidatus Alcyoniella australis]|nr:UDP-N-acetylglucosamine 2-epimerase (non-hydrolyzing) [Candidatus Alcyoniella australis]